MLLIDVLAIAFCFVDEHFVLPEEGHCSRSNEDGQCSSSQWADDDRWDERKNQSKEASCFWWKEKRMMGPKERKKKRRKEGV